MTIPLDAIPWINFESFCADAAAKSVESKLWQVDLAGEVAAGADLSAVKGALLSCGSKFAESKGVVTRVYQLLSDVEMLAPPAARINVADMPVLLASLATHVVMFKSHADVLTNAFELICSLVTRDSALLSPATVGTKLLQDMVQSVAQHVHSSHVKRAALQLFSALFAAEGSQAGGGMSLHAAVGEELLPLLADVLLTSRAEPDTARCALFLVRSLLQCPAPAAAELGRSRLGAVVTAVSALLEHAPPGDGAAPLSPTAAAADAAILGECFMVLDLLLSSSSSSESIVLDVAGPVLRFAAASVASMFAPPAPPADAAAGAIGGAAAAARDAAALLALLKVLRVLAAEPDILGLGLEGGEEEARACLAAVVTSSAPLFSVSGGGGGGGGGGGEHKQRQQSCYEGGAAAVWAVYVRATECQQGELVAAAAALRASCLALPVSMRPAPLLQGLQGGGEGAAARAGAGAGAGEETKSRPSEVASRAAAAAVPPAKEGGRPLPAPADPTAAAAAVATSPAAAKKEQDQETLVSFADACQQQAAQAIARADMMHQMFVDAAARIESLVAENAALRLRVQQLEGTGAGAGDASVATTHSSLTTATAATETDAGAGAGAGAGRLRTPLRIPATPTGSAVLVLGGGRSGARADSCDTSTDDGGGSCLTPSAKTTGKAGAGAGAGADRLVGMAVAGMQEALAALQEKQDKRNAAKDQGRGGAMAVPVAVPVAALYMYAETFRAAMGYAKANIPATIEKLKPHSLAMSSVRKFVRAVGLLDDPCFSAKHLDLVLSRVGVLHVSLFGFTYVLVVCAGERYAGAGMGGGEVLEKLLQLMSTFLSTAAAAATPPGAGSSGSSVGAGEQGLVSRLLDSEKPTLQVIFDCYVSVPIVLQRNALRHWSLQSAAAFALDFDIIPQITSQDRLRSLFHQHAQADNQLQYPAFCALLVSLARHLGEEGQQGQGQGQGQVVTLVCDLLMLLNSRIVAWHEKVSRRLFHNHRSIKMVSFNLQSIRTAHCSVTPPPKAPLAFSLSQQGDERV